MNILFLTTHVNTGGITSYILTLGEGLVKSGHKVLVASSGGDCEAQLEAVGIRHVKVNIRTKSELHPKLFLSFPLLKGLIIKENIDIIHAQTRVTQLLGYWLSFFTKARMVTTCHGFFKPRFFRQAFPCWGSAVIAISKPVVQHLSVDFRVAHNDIYLIPNGVDLERFTVADQQQRRSVRQEKGMGDEPLIGIIARLSDVKGIDVLIRAMPIVLKEITSAKLLIVGQGPEEALLKKLAEDLSLTGQIKFEDTINQPHKLLPAFDVFVMPSLMEGLGLSVMEAQACGIPVVASKVGGLIDLIENGVSGYLVESNDPSALAARIIDVLKDPAQAKKMAFQARRNIEQFFTAQIMTRKTLEVYEQYTRC